MQTYKVDVSTTTTHYCLANTIEEAVEIIQKRLNLQDSAYSSFKATEMPK